MLQKFISANQIKHDSTQQQLDYILDHALAKHSLYKALKIAPSDRINLKQMKPEVLENFYQQALMEEMQEHLAAAKMNTELTADLQDRFKLFKEDGYVLSL